jgi:membrane-associated protease RseP (regulator of RpoE activity)
MFDTGYNDFLRTPLAALGEPLPDHLAIDGFTGISAFGKDGEGSCLCWLPRVELASVALPGTVISAQPGGKALLGNRFFERTRIVLDWQQRLLFVDHPEKLGRQELRSHGLAIYPEHDGVRVANVVAGSPAAAARLQPGDRVLAVDDIDLEAGNTAAFFRAFVLVRQEPDKLVVTVRRDGKPVAIELRPLHLLPH